MASKLGKPTTDKFQYVLPKYLQKYMIGMVVIPKPFISAMSTVLKGIRRKFLKQEIKAMSGVFEKRKLKLGETIPELAEQVVYPKTRALAYVAYKAPSVYACNFRVFTEVSKRIGSVFEPKKMLDFGSGCGTTLWSASEVWNSIDDYTGIEISNHMTSVAQQLLSDFENVTFQRFFVRSQQIAYDLVTATFTLSELPSQQRRFEVLDNLWDALSPGGIIVITEVGSNFGFSIIKEAREHLLENQLSTVIAPCPHSEDCPMGKDSFCHFSQRLQRPPILQASKYDQTKNYEDEKFSYIAIRKKRFDGQKSGEQTGSKLVRTPLFGDRHVTLDVCDPSGQLLRKVIPKTYGKEIYKSCRESFWGDSIVLTDEFKERRGTRYSKHKNSSKDSVEASESETEN